MIMKIVKMMCAEINSNMPTATTLAPHSSPSNIYKQISNSLSSTTVTDDIGWTPEHMQKGSDCI